MKFLKSHKKLIGVLMIILVVGIFMPMHGAQAACNIVSWSVEGCVLEVAQTMYTIIGALISAFAYFLELVIGFSQEPSILAPDVIHQVWGIVRNIVNMFFILVLIIMAFGTIFDMPHYTFKDMFRNFLIAALLINFSFVIVEFILSIANGLAAVFINQIGSSIGTRFGESLMLAKGSSAVGATITSTLMFLVFAIITCGTLLAAGIFVMIRIVVVWILIMLSPVAWFGYTLPALKGETWDKWWSYFISWAFFLPVYLFFVMIAAIIVGAKGTIGANIDWDKIVDGSAGEIARATFDLFGITDILFFAVAIFFLIGGIKLAFTVGNFAAHGAGAAMTWGQNRVKGMNIPYLGKAAGALGVGDGSSLSANSIMNAGKGYGEGFLEKGFKSKFLNRYAFGGKDAAKRDDEYGKNLGQVLGGYRSKADLAPTEEVSQTKHHVEEYKRKIKNGELTQDEIKDKLKHVDDIIAGNGRVDTHEAAYFSLAAEQGILDGNTLVALMEKLKGKNMGLANEIGDSYVKNVQDKKQLLAMAAPNTDPATASATDKLFASKEMSSIRKQASMALISDEGREGLQKASPIQVKQLIDATVRDYGVDSQITLKFMKDAAKISPEDVFAYISTPGNPTIPKFKFGAGGTFPDKQTFYRENWQKDKEELAKLKTDVWTDLDFLAELEKRAPPRDTSARDKYRQDLAQKITDSGGTDSSIKMAHMLAAIV